MDKTKPFSIPKALVMKAYRLVKANRGAAGVDRQSLENFEVHWKDNLYKLWNRLSSGSYFPPPVRSVSIPKKQGGKRILGVPTVADRIGQMVIKLLWEPQVEPYFLPDSYGYRPRKSALDGYSENIPQSHGVAMRMMDCCTVEQKGKPRISGCDLLLLKGVSGGKSAPALEISQQTRGDNTNSEK